jgi:hypothetical protein
MTSRRSHHRSYDVAVAEPFRLDLTVQALRRLPVNVVDVFVDQQYCRAFDSAHGLVVTTVTQASPRLLTLSITGAPAEHASTRHALLPSAARPPASARRG